MKKAILDYSFSLLISIIIISFIVYIGFFELNSYNSIKDIQMLNKGIDELNNGFNYLISNGGVYGFLQTSITIPDNEIIIFDNISNNVSFYGVYNGTFDFNIDLLTYLELNQSGEYLITLCYSCNSSKDYLVIFE